ncbi:MAG: TonB-dependent receptor [Rikenellaceae bacterium]|nr:TonB-dependent receptor [Rikenellaceae bacterium]
MDKKLKRKLSGYKPALARFFTVVLMSVMTTVAFAQNRTVNGTVKDTKGAPMPGVSVYIPGTSMGTVTNGAGEFSLSGVPDDAIIQVNFLGYEQQDIPVAGRTTINVVMEEDSQNIEDVVVIGYGTQSRANNAGSIAKITSAQIESRPVTRLENALQGQMAGVSVRNTTGKPGADIEVRIRGAASITGDSKPLYVVDGIPLESLQGINPGDIESIDVLKDAASAAIYGSRGSNGVVLVTTKRGKEGKATVTLNAYTGFGTLERKVDVLDSYEWVEFNKKYYDRKWTLNGGSASDSQATRIQAAIAAGDLASSDMGDRAALSAIKGTYGLYDPWWDSTGDIEAIDWQDALFRNAPISDVQLSISGANERVNYTVSGGILDQKGLVAGSEFKRYTGRIRVGIKANDYLTINANLAPSVSNSYGTQVDGKDLAVARALSFPGWVPAGAGKYAGADPYKFYDAYWGPGPNNVSPYVQATGPFAREDYIRLNSSVDAIVNVYKGLTVTGTYAWNYYTRTDRSYTPTYMSGTWDTADYEGQRSSSSYRTWINHNTLAQVLANYTHSWANGHSLDVMAAASQERTSDRSTRQQMSDFPNDKTYVFDKDKGSTTGYNTTAYEENAIVSYFGRVIYNYKDRYILTASFRRDGSSKFGPNNRWGNFPSVALAWRFTEEPFFGNNEWLSQGKLRLSWGLAGNDRIGNAKWISTMVSRNYVFGDASTNGYIMNNIANPDLGWESTSSTNVGLDFTFLNGRIQFSADYYYKMTKDLLLDTPVSAITGFTSMTDNVGRVRNWGMEFDVTSFNISKANFRWSTDLNISFNRNKIMELSDGDADIIFGSTVNALIHRKGHAINSYYLYEAERTLRESDFDSNGNALVPIMVNQGVGDTKWKDQNGDGVIDQNDKIVAGSLEPKFEWGITNTFTYKNWDLSIFINGRIGGKLLASGSRGWNRATDGPGWNYLNTWLYDAYWSEDEPGNGKTPAFWATTTGNNYDTNWLYNATYVRLKNIQLGYNWTPNFKQISNLRVYVSCDNVYLWDHYKPGFSPEGATQDNASADWGSYPVPRTFIVGVSITF